MIEFLNTETHTPVLLMNHRNLTHTSLDGPMTWKVMQRNVWRDIASWRTKPPSNCTKSERHAWMTINLRKKKLGSVGEFSNVCSQIVLKCLYLARIGRPDILWAVNKLARSITKWTKACESIDFICSTYL